MPSLGQPNFSNFSGGELSPKMKGRFDLPIHQSSLELSQNFTILPQGGIRRRDGSLFVAEGTNNAKKSILLPIIFNLNESFILEITDLAASIFRFDGTTAERVAGVSLVTPWTESELLELDYAVFDDSIYITHENSAPVRIKRVAFNSWTVINFDDANELLNPEPEDIPVALSQAQNAVKVPYVGNTENPLFLDGTRISTKDTLNTGGSQLILDFKETQLASTTDQSTAIDILATGAFTFTSSDVGAVIKTVGRTTDVSKGIHGYYIITAFVSSVAVKGKLLTTSATDPLADGTRAMARWVAWHKGRSGYPRTICVFEDRIVFGGVPSAGFIPEIELTIWGTKPGDFTNLDNGVAFTDVTAASSYAFTLSSRNGAGRIRWLRPSRVLLVGTDLAEQRILSGVNALSIDAKRQTFHGSFNANSMELLESVYFIQRDRKTLRRLDFNDTIDNYIATDMNILSDEILGTGTTVFAQQMAFQQKPETTLFIVRSDGQLIALTINRELGTNAWHRHKIADGTAVSIVESVAVIPSNDGQEDRVWITVKRTIGGATKRHIEVLDKACNTDGAKKYTGVSSNILTGLGHLDGQKVDALGDGIFLGQFTVSGGQIDVGRTVTNAEVGLHYDADATLMPFPTRPDSKKRNSILQARLLNARAGIRINEEELIFFQGGAPMDSIPALVTGLKKIVDLGWTEDAQIRVKAALPYDGTILAIAGRLSIGD